MNFFTLILTILLMTSCVSQEGSFQAFDRLLIDSDIIEKNKYRVSVKIKKSTKMVLKLKSEEAKHKFAINFPKNKPLPEFNIDKIHEKYQNCLHNSKCDGDNARKLHTINYEASELNIDYNLKGAMNVDYKKTLKYDDNEPCRIVPNLNECRYYEQGGSSSNSMCRGVPGTRKSSYFIHHYVLSLSLRFLGPSSLEDSALMTSMEARKFREYIYKGTCYPEKTNN